MTQLTREAIKQEVSKFVRDPIYFLRLVLNEWFPDDIPWFHRGIIAIILRRVDFLENYEHTDKIIKYFVWREDPWDEKSPAYPLFSRDENGRISLKITKHTLIMLPRGFAKTTLLNGIALYLLLFREKRFFVYLSETQPHAAQQLQNVQRQVDSNQLIQTFFGNLRPARNANERWAADFFETTTGVAMAAKGSGSQVRGLNVNGIRPSLLLFDDAEDREKVKSDTQRSETRLWFFRDALPTLPRRDNDAFAVYLGTLLGSDSLAMTISRDRRFNTVIFGAELEGEALWPEHMSLETIKLEKDAATGNGDLAGFYMEFYNKLRDESSAKFKLKYFIYEPFQNKEDIEIAMAVDPAISAKKGSSACAFAVVAMNTKTGLIHILEACGRIGMSPREQVDMYFDLHFKWDVKHHGVESIAYQASLIHLLREEMFRKAHNDRNAYFEITPITHAVKKEDRINGVLQPRYAAGYIRHQKRFPEYEAQLLDFPNGQMDFPDVVAMAITLLDPYAASAADPSLDLGKDEYEPLDKIFKGGWRRN